MLLPALMRAREVSKRTSCSSNLKQLNVGVLTYAGDFQDYIVPGYYYKSDTGWKDKSAYSWLGLIRTYLGCNLPIYSGFCCFNGPSDLKAAVCPSSPARWGYGHNAPFTSLYIGGSIYTKFRKYNAFRSPSRVILLADNYYSKSSNPSTGWYPCLQNLSGSYEAISWSRIYPVHAEIANVSYLDGHVDTMSKALVLSIYGKSESDKEYFGKQ
jgi:prepilin-type processing-associated H-X9-DG protein